jgi:hypothetical protein
MSLRRLYPAVSTCIRVMTCYRGLLCFVLLVCCCTANISAQGSNATINGQITDPAGRVVPGTEVQAVNIDTNVVYPSKSNGSGIYVVSGLIPGRYRLMVRKDGFKVINKTDVTLHVQDILEQNFALEVGSISESITVEGGGQVINTTDASVSTVIDRKFVENIPLNGRSFQDLISMTPGVVTASPQSGTSGSTLAFSGDFSVNGQRTESNYYMVDGVSANTGAGNGFGGSQAGTSGSLAASTALGTTQNLLSVDALEEFRVQSSTYSAEYGRSPGGQFSFVTRSGGNSVHGSVFDYLRNDFFDANDWFNDKFGKRITALRQNDFGGTVGGPILLPKIYDGRNRSFFFVSYEGLRLTQPQAATVQYVPDSCMRQAAPASLQPILNAFPLQNGIDYGSCPAGGTANPSLAQFIQTYSLPSRIDSTSVRIDYTVSPKLSLFVRSGYTPSSSASRSNFALTSTNISSQNYTIGATSQISGKISDEFRLGFARSDAGVHASLDSFGGAMPIDLASAMGAVQPGNPQPFTQITVSGVGSAGIGTTESANRARQWNVVDTLNISFGAHHLKLGVDDRHITSPTVSTNLVEGLFSSASTVLSNKSTLIVFNRLPSTPVFNEFSAFVQDEWRASQAVSLSFGIRWEVNPPPTEASGHDAYTVLGNLSSPSSLTLAPRGTPLWKTPWTSLAPRLGVAWKARGQAGWETVVRTGGGVFFDTDDELAVNGFTGIGFSALAVSANAPLPATASQISIAPSVSAPYTSAAVYAFPQHLQLPYTLQWNTSLDQSLGRNQVFSLAYIGSNGRRLPATQDYSLSSHNPQFGTVFYFPGNVTSNYQALQSKFQRSVSSGLQALLSYTWSHSLDFGSTGSALPLMRGNSDFDVRQNFQAGVNWDIPQRKLKGVVASAIGGWSLDGRFIARSGFPITLNGSQHTDPASGNIYFGGLNLVQGQPIYLYGPQYPGGKAVNKAAFTVPASNVSGSAPRNFVRGFGANQINLAARKQFALGEAVKLQFRAEVFNIVNHPNFGFVDPTFNDATFGTSTKMLNQSLGTVASQYQQGGPRSMQFALKLLF